MSGCLRPAPEDKENHACFFLLLLLLLFFWFGECFLEHLKGQGRTLSPEAGNLEISGHSNTLGSREKEAPYGDK